MDLIQICLRYRNIITTWYKIEQILSWISHQLTFSNERDYKRHKSLWCTCKEFSNFASNDRTIGSQEWMDHFSGITTEYWSYLTGQDSGRALTCYDIERSSWWEFIHLKCGRLVRMGLTVGARDTCKCVTPWVPISAIRYSQEGNISWKRHFPITIELPHSSLGRQQHNYEFFLSWSQAWSCSIQRHVYQS